MVKLYLRLSNWIRLEAGQDLIEYGLIIALVATLAVATLAAMGGQVAAIWPAVSTWFNNIAKNIGK